MSQALLKVGQFRDQTEWKETMSEASPD